MLFQSSQVINALGYSNGLKPSRWLALRCFAKVNPSARSLSAFANAITKGAASRTITALAARGLVAADTLSGDLRRRRIGLADAGLALLASDHLNRVLTCWTGSIPPEDRHGQGPRNPGLRPVRVAVQQS